MASLSIEFKKALNNEEIDYNLLIPILNWISGCEKNIEICQTINKRLFFTKSTILARYLTLNNMLHRFIKYPKSFTEDKNILFFYNDVCSYFGWTKRELYKNLTVINMEELKELISRMFAYNNKERKILGLEAIKNARGKNIQTN
jgi:hypothetical protein